MTFTKVLTVAVKYSYKVFAANWEVLLQNPKYISKLVKIQRCKIWLFIYQMWLACLEQWYYKAPFLVNAHERWYKKRDSKLLKLRSNTCEIK